MGDVVEEIKDTKEQHEKENKAKIEGDLDIDVSNIKRQMTFLES